MPSAFTDSQHIDASPEQVWTTLTDWSRASAWMPGVTDMRSDGPVREGAVLSFTAQGKARTSTITRVDPGRSITMSSTVPGVAADYLYTLSESAGGTAISLDAQVTTHGPMKALGKVIRGAIAKEDGVQLSRLKVLIESEATAL
jgi:carbon monoxide dehydrogenase subunit G